MKEGAEKVELKIQAKVESLKHANEGDKGTQWLNLSLCFASFLSKAYIFRRFQVKEKHMFIQYYN